MLVILKWLMRHDKPFIIPAKIIGKAIKEISKSKSSKWTTYQIKSSKQGTLDLEIVVHCFNKREKGKAKGSRKTYLYATWGFEGKIQNGLRKLIESVLG